jgi:hypothetical protein
MLGIYNERVMQQDILNITDSMERMYICNYTSEVWALVML